MQGAYMTHYLLNMTSRCIKRRILTCNCWYMQNTLEIKGVTLVYFPSNQSQLLTRFPPFLCLNAHYEAKVYILHPYFENRPPK